MYKYLIIGLILFPGITGITAQKRPNIILIMADDLGFSDIGAYGGEIRTPNIDKLAKNGVKYSHFYNESRCCPSRASLLTGRSPHMVDLGWMTAADEHRSGYRGQLSFDFPLLPEILHTAGYKCYGSGKWHLTIDSNYRNKPNGSWPTQRGFDEFYGLLHKGGSYSKPETLINGLKPLNASNLPQNYYLTNACTDTAISYLEKHDKLSPYFLYLPYYAPHRPLQAPESRIEACRKIYKNGYDVLRQNRFDQLKKIGLISMDAKLGNPNHLPPWDKLTEKQRENWITEMSTYAAMVEIMDDGIGKIMDYLKKNGLDKNTLILFLSDNGATSEGGFISELGANLSNTPFRNYKRKCFLGGVASPLIVYWPEKLKNQTGEIRMERTSIRNILSMCIEATQTEYPKNFQGNDLPEIMEASLVKGNENSNKVFCWEHQCCRAVETAKWRMVSPQENAAWQLFNLKTDPFESTDLSTKHPEVVKNMESIWMDWAKKNKVLPLESKPWDERIKYYSNLHEIQTGQWLPNKQIIRKVADYVLKNTSYRLYDLAKNISYTKSDTLSPSKSIIVESHFNGWFYQNMMVLDGMNRIGKAIDDSIYTNYSNKNLDFILRNLDFFDRQQAEGLMPKPRGEDKFSRISYYYNLSLPWMTGLTNFWLERGFDTGDKRYLVFTNRFRNFVESQPRDSSGQFLNLGAIRTDDAALMTPGMLQLARINNYEKYTTDAVKQVLGVHRILFDPTDKLYYHGYHPEENTWYKTYWGRGSGWMALAYVNLLSTLPEDYPKKAAVLQAYREFMESLRKWQAPEGGWRQVINRPEAWIETSCTGMFTYALARGVNEGWLDSSYAADARKGWKALCLKVKEDGVMVDTCPSTHHSDKIRYYLDRPKTIDNPHAYGPFLLAGAEIIKLKQP